MGGLGRGEDALDVDGAERGGLGGVVDHDLAVVLTGAQRPGGQPPDVDEVREVGELVELGQLVDRGNRQRHVVAAGDVQQGGRADRALEVDVQLNLGSNSEGVRHVHSTT